MLTYPPTSAWCGGTDGKQDPSKVTRSPHRAQYIRPRYPDFVILSEGPGSGLLHRRMHNLLFISDPKDALFDLSQAGNVVTGEMVEELILSGADIIKVGIGPGKLVCWCPFPALWWQTPLGYFTPIFCCVLPRFCVYYPEENWSRLSPAQCSDGVCRCCSWPQRPHHLSKAQGQGRL